MLANDYGTTQMRKGVDVLIEQNEGGGLSQLPLEADYQTKKMQAQHLHRRTNMVEADKKFKLRITVCGMANKGLLSDVPINRDEILMQEMNFAYH